MFPSECLLDRRVRSDADKDLAATNLPLFILNCNKYRKAEGYAANRLEIQNQRLKDMVLGVRLADAPPAVSYLAILGCLVSADIVAIDRTVIVIRLDIPGEAGQSYLIYDAAALSLHMIPAPQDPSWFYTLGSSVSVARPCHGHDYALVHTGRLVAGGADSLFLWWPSSSSPPWSKFRKALIDWSAYSTNMEFSFNGHAYWADLLCGVFCCSCDAIFDFDHNSSVAKFHPFIPLPVDQAPADPDHRIAEPAAYRTMGVVRDSFVRFVSIDGFQLNYVKLKKRTVTVWKLLLDHGDDRDQPWEEEHKFSLKTLWGFEGFGDLPKDLTPMYPLLSTQDTDVLYLGLGEYEETRFGSERTFCPSGPRYLLALDMRNKIVRTSVPVEDQDIWIFTPVSCGFSPYFHRALDGPCDDDGIPMNKKSPISP